MTRDEAVAEALEILGYRSSADKGAELERGLRFQQAELEKQPELPYFLKEEVLNLTCTANVERMAPPTGFLREWDEDALWVQVTEDGIQKWRELEKDGPRYLRNSINNLQSDNDLTDAQIPRAYSYDGKDFILFPTPDAVYTFRMIYYKEDVVLNSNIENKWLKHLPYFLIGRAGAKVATSMRDKDALGTFASLIQAGTVQLNALTVSRDGAGRKYVVGGPD